MIAPAHIGQGSNVTYNVQFSKRQLEFISLARAIAVSSAWANVEWVVSRSLYPVLIILSSHTITAPIGTSPNFSAFLASKIARSIWYSSLLGIIYHLIYFLLFLIL